MTFEWISGLKFALSISGRVWPFILIGPDGEVFYAGREVPVDLLPYPGVFTLAVNQDSVKIEQKADIVIIHIECSFLGVFS